MWSQKGWEETDNAKRQVARFKDYSWARLFRLGDDHKDIFFTVGVHGSDGGYLVYKIDYYFEKNSYLSESQKQIVNENIPVEMKWITVGKDHIGDYDWEKLISESTSFITENLQLYDKLIKLAWGDESPEEIFSNGLRKKSFPDSGLEFLPEVIPSFNPVEKDYIKEASEQIELGIAGEELVIQYEKRWLENRGLIDLAEKVKKVKDGLGYDILSFSDDGKPKYIEVKTTNDSVQTPFYYSDNERLFGVIHVSNYLIYRLYNYDDLSNTADFFIIEEVPSKLLLQPINFKVYIKKQ